MGFVKAILAVEKDLPIICQFNPSEYDVSNGVKYVDKTIPGSQSTIHQFVSGESPTLTLSLLFDTYIPPSIDVPVEGGIDVTLLTRRVIELTHIKGSLHRPPIVTFLWGTVTFRGIVTSVKQKFTLFLASGIPVRAKLDVTFKAAEDSTILSMLSPLESPDRTKYRVMKQGEHLWNYANEEYGSPSMWRVIAKENGIMNPLDVEAGQHLKLPSI